MKRTFALVAVLALVIGVTPRLSVLAQGDPVQMLPDGVGLAVFDVQKVTSSELWGALGQKQGAKKFIDKVQSHLLDLGLKLSDLNTLAMSFPSSGVSNVSMIVTGSFNGDDVLAKLRANPKVKLTSETYKNLQVQRAVYTDGASHSDTWFAFLDAGVATVGAQSGVHATIDVRAGDKPSIAQDAKIMAGMSENQPSAVRFVLAPNGGLLGALESGNIPLPDFSTVSIIFGTVGVASGIDLNITIRNDTADHAKAMSNQLSGLLAMARGFLGSSTDPKMAPIADAVKTVTVTDSGMDVKISGSLSKELLARVIH
jgi:hypothetical protein